MCRDSGSDRLAGIRAAQDVFAIPPSAGAELTVMVMVMVSKKLI